MNRQKCSGIRISYLVVPVSDANIGPAEYMMKVLKFDTQHSIASNAEIAQMLLEKLIHRGFDATRMGAIEDGNNLMMLFFLSIQNLIFP